MSAQKNEQVITREVISSAEPTFQMRADEDAQMACVTPVKASVSDRVEVELLAGVMKHPFLRHLMELYLNNSGTSLRFSSGAA